MTLRRKAALGARKARTQGALVAALRAPLRTRSAAPGASYRRATTGADGGMKPSLATSMVEVVRALPALPVLLFRPSISWQTAERMMVVVSAVNRCRYCAYVHERAAVRSGVAPDEVRLLGELELGRVSEMEAVALTFARDYAESGGRTSRWARENLGAAYGTRMSEQILAVVRLITLANALGNAFDHVVLRRGRDRR